MEKEVVKHQHNQLHNTSTTTNSISSSAASLRERQIIGEGLIKPAHSADFELRWGSRKRLRCTKIPSFRVDRRAVISENNNSNSNGINGSNHHQHTTNGHFNLRQRAVSPAQPLHQRVLRYTPWALSFSALFYDVHLNWLAIACLCALDCIGDWGFLICGSWFWTFSCFLVHRKPLVLMDDVGGIWAKVSFDIIGILHSWLSWHLCILGFLSSDEGTHWIKAYQGTIRSERVG